MLPQCGIALAKRLAIALPVGEERLFHVEHTPVEKLPSLFGPRLKQCMARRTHQLQGKTVNEFGQLSHGLTAKPDLLPVLATFYSDRDDAPGITLQRSLHQKTFRASADQLIGMVGTK
jgi:hypothetical protein